MTYLLSQGLLGGLSRAELRLTVLVYPVNADGRWRVLVGLAIALHLLSATTTVALIVGVRHLVDLFKRRVLTRPIQWTLIAAPFCLLGAWIRAGGGCVDVR